MGGGRGGPPRGKPFNPSIPDRPRKPATDPKGGGGGFDGPPDGSGPRECWLQDTDDAVVSRTARGDVLRLRTHRGTVHALTEQGERVGVLDQRCAERFNEMGVRHARIATIRPPAAARAAQVRVEPVLGDRA